MVACELQQSRSDVVGALRMDIVVSPFEPDRINSAAALNDERIDRRSALSASVCITAVGDKESHRCSRTRQRISGLMAA